MRNFLAWGLLAALALPARADIVDGGNLQIGGQGLFGGTVTVQGNALGVAGSVSATSATLSGTGAQTYALTTSSGIHVVNGKLKLDSGAMIQWPDGTTSTTAASASGDSGGMTITSGSTLAVNSGAYCTGTSCRVDYSSGTSGNFSFVLQSSTTYEWYFAIAITSGSTANPYIVSCTVNGNTTASNYFQSGTTYPTARSINNQGAVAYFSPFYLGGGVVGSVDFAQGRYLFNSVRAQSNRLSGTGTTSSTEGSQASLQAGTYGILFKGAPPWTFTCSLYVGYGWAYESILYQVGI